MKILTLTCWSHAIRYHLFSWEERTQLAAGIVERMALGNSFIRQQASGREPFCRQTDNSDHPSAIALILATLTEAQHGVIAAIGEITAVGHRVAHGGNEFRHSVRLDAQVLASIRELHHLAPLHLAPNIAGIEAAMALLPAIPHTATFDTAFHCSLPEYAYRYPLPYEWCEQYGVRRYGFHGPSHLYLSRRAAVLLGKPVTDCNLITIHLDRGVSLCAIRNGLSIDTSMGMTPLEGAVMETRCGDIDPGIHAFIMQQLNLSAHELEQVLNQKSGIFGMTGQRLERRHYLQAAVAGDSRCKAALAVESYRIRKYIGAYLAVIGPLDAIVFSMGTGATEWPLREEALQDLECFGIGLDQGKNRTIHSEQEEVEITGDAALIRIFVMPTNEELVIAEDVAAIHAGSYRDQRHETYSFAGKDFDPAASM